MSQLAERLASGLGPEDEDVAGGGAPVATHFRSASSPTAAPSAAANIAVAGDEGQKYFQQAYKNYFLAPGMTESDYNEAHRLAQLAADLGSADGKALLGLSYVMGNGVARDVPRGAALIQEAAAEGSALGTACLGECQRWLGDCYYFGWGVAQSLQQAARWHRLTKAQCQNGLIYWNGSPYRNGCHVPEDLAEALQRVVPAEDQVDPLAEACSPSTPPSVAPSTATAGIIKGDEDGGEAQASPPTVPPSTATSTAAAGVIKGDDDEQASPPSAAAGSAASGNGGQEYFQHAYKNYFGAPGMTASARGEAHRLAQIAADLGSADGKALLGLGYVHGKGVARDKRRRGFSLLQEAAAEGSAFGTACLGYCYVRGWGVRDDAAHGQGLLREAADRGDAYGQWKLGECYQCGWGVAKSAEEAARWYRLAAKQGLPEAQYDLGKFYANGWGVPKDPAEALRWCERAAKQGYPVAKGHASQLRQELGLR